MYINRVEFTGTIGSLVITRKRNGQLMSKLRVVFNEFWEDKVTNIQQRRDHWFTVWYYGENLANKLKKFAIPGLQCYVEGKLGTSGSGHAMTVWGKRFDTVGRFQDIPFRTPDEIREFEETNQFDEKDLK